MNQDTKRRQFLRRKVRVRKGFRRDSSRPRLNVFRSNAHIYAQIIDDASSRTLVSASSRDAMVREQVKSGGSQEAATAVGKLLAERAKAAKVNAVVFDRGGRLYHGRVKALADASREGGLDF